MNILVLLVVLRFKLFDGSILSRFDLGNFCFALGLHVLPQARHLSFVLLLDLIGNTLILLTLCSCNRIEVLVERIRILSLAHFLLLLLDFECAQILLQRTLVYSVLIFGVLQLDLSLLLDHGFPVEILEEQMLQALAPDLDRDVVFLFEVLMLTILVAQLGLLVLFLLFGD